MFICIAGKNNIAVDVLGYILSLNLDAKIGVVCNKTETGRNTWQKSLRWFAEKWNVEEFELEDLYSIDDLVFLSLEFDRIVKTELFKNARCYNIHFSLLPAYKGMYTSVFPILNGEKTVGVTFHKIDDGIDTGDIIAQKSFLLENHNCREVYNLFIKYGTELVIECLDWVINNKVKAFAQPSTCSSYFSKSSINYNDLALDVIQTAENINRQIRAFTFREYQLLNFNGKQLIGSKVLKIKSNQKPGTILFENETSAVLATIDYYIVLYFDRFEELMIACENGNVDLVYNICTIREHIDEKNNRGWTPLMVATYFNHIDIVKHLISLGANIFATNNNGTNLLMYAKDAFLHYGDKTLLKLYKSLGLSEYTKTIMGRT